MRETSNMTRVEVSGDVWTIPGQAPQVKEGFLAAPEPGRNPVCWPRLPEIAGKPGWVFTHDGKRPIGGFSRFKLPVRRGHADRAAQG